MFSRSLTLAPFFGAFSRFHVFPSVSACHGTYLPSRSIGLVHQDLESELEGCVHCMRGSFNTMMMHALLHRDLVVRLYHERPPVATGRHPEPARPSIRPASHCLSPFVPCRHSVSVMSIPRGKKGRQTIRPLFCASIRDRCGPTGCSKCAPALIDFLGRKAIVEQKQSAALADLHL